MIVSLAVLAVLLAALAWFFVAGRSGAPEPTARRRVGEEIDYSELEAAERDVQEATDEDSVRDWGPGTPKPPVA